MGTSVAPNPSDMDAVRMKRVRQVKDIVDIILIPEMATALKRNVVIPPRTALGMATKAAANMEKTPMMIRKKQQELPALQFAQRVSTITPLFWALKKSVSLSDDNIEWEVLKGGAGGRVECIWLFCLAENE
jgi:hypothetical protein